MSDTLPDKFADHLKTLCPDWRRVRFMVAFSGGLDSTALLHLMALCRPAAQLAAAHLNHELRGEAAAADQKFAEKTAAGLSVEFIAASRDVGALARERRRGVEEAARRARYDFLAGAAAAWGADYVLTAHQADDQAETMLMNFLKGSGAGGLAGIHPRRPLRRPGTAGPGERPVELVRPLLPFSRGELQAWLEARGLPWVEDLSNRDGHYLRNALRGDLIPRLKRLNPRFTEALGRSALVLRAEEDFWAAHLAGLWADLVTEEAPARFSVDRRGLSGLTVAEQRRLIYEVLNKIWLTRPRTGEPLSFASVETLRSMLAQARHPGLDLPGGLRAALTAEVVRFSLASRLVDSSPAD